MNYTQIMAYVKDLAHQAGRIMLAAHDEAEKTAKTKSGSANFVTAYDIAVQEHLIKRLRERFPEAVFIAEEKDNDPSLLEREFCFVIDPIDGTTNFMHNYKCSAISIAMVSHGETVIGVVYDPYRGELYHAEKGKGAFLNDKPIHVSERCSEQAVVALGTSPYYKDTLAEKTFSLARDVYCRVGDLRRTGTAALDLAYVAVGRTEGFFEWILSPWDHAAGVLLVTEAGGIVTQADGSPTVLSAPCSVWAGNRMVHAVLIDAAKRYC